MATFSFWGVDINPKTKVQVFVPEDNVLNVCTAALIPENGDPTSGEKSTESASISILTAGKSLFSTKR
ncbi:hypothetical protein MHBO_000145 [Bonamia ostreae]|uniref:Uncharacterized protein n=1 Tax=Bonamia ostreae TaxID=126728 RepID=A0ABV2AF94_9EUKA